MLTSKQKILFLIFRVNLQLLKLQLPLLQSYLHLKTLNMLTILFCRGTEYVLSIKYNLPTSLSRRSSLKIINLKKR